MAYSLMVAGGLRNRGDIIKAIAFGADAVYIGAHRFGAREKAGNSVRDIAALTEYAHLYWSKVYVVLNTLLYDHEVPQAVHLAQQLYDIGVDALIIQDYALLQCDLPPIPLIASTQMHNNTPERVRFLELVGFHRVILARELTLKEIKTIRESTKIELEVFVHGALCVSYSGRCYMSYAIGGRSGNRGQCAQPCRRTYSLVDTEDNVLSSDKHLLSLKDLNRLDDLDDLLDAGITSFKIEGRLKDKIYITNVVSKYRQALDSVIAKRKFRASSSGSIEYNFTPDVDKTFNRGYTPYFLRGRNVKPGAIDTPKMIGEPLGTVLNVKNRTILLDSGQRIVPGDGVCWFDQDHKLQGTSVNQVDGPQVTLNQNKGINKGVILYRNHDHAYITAIKRNEPVRKIGVELTLEEITSGYKLIACDTDGNLVTEQENITKEKAIKEEAALSTIKKQLSRMGGTPYKCTDVAVLCSYIPFIPASQLNTLRRNTLHTLTEKRFLNRPIIPHYVKSDGKPIYPEIQLDYRHNVLNSSAAAFLQQYGVQTIEQAAESGLDLKGRTIMRTRQCIKRQLGLCTGRNHTRDDDQQLYLVDEDGRRFPLVFDCKECEMEVLF